MTRGLVPEGLNKSYNNMIIYLIILIFPNKIVSYFVTLNYY